MTLWRKWDLDLIGKGYSFGDWCSDRFVMLCDEIKYLLRRYCKMNIW